MKKSGIDRLQRLLSQIMKSYSNFDTATTNLDIIDLEEAANITEDFIKTCQNTEMVERLDLERDVYIIGDINGQLSTLKLLLEKINADSNFVFLGNYIKEGPKSLYCILVVFMLKIINPKTVVLRGCAETLESGTLFNDILFHYLGKDVYESQSFKENYENCTRLYKMFKLAFSCMPLCAIVGNTYFLSHAGIAQDENFLERIQHIKVPFFLDSLDFCSPQKPDTTDPKDVVTIAMELTWNTGRAQTSQNGNQSSSNTFSDLSNSGNFKSYNDSAVQTFLRTNKLRTIINAHDPVKGYLINSSQTCITLTSNGQYRSLLCLSSNGTWKVIEFF